MVRAKGTLLSSFGALLLAAHALPGCSSAGIDSADAEDVGEQSLAINQGTVANAWPNGTDAAKSVVRIPGCTGTVIRSSWVLTAAHCGFSAGATVESRRQNGTIVTRTVDLSLPHPDRKDLRLLHVSSPFTDVPKSPIYAGTNASLWGKSLTCYGYGGAGYCDANGSCPSGQTCNGEGLCYDNTPKLRRGTLVPGSYSTYPTEAYYLPPNAAGQYSILPGDSGGPCFLDGAVVGVHSIGDADMGTVTAREWLTTPSRVAFTPGDFNGDGRTDVIVTTAAGSDFLYATANAGTWTLGHQRADLRLGTVKFTPGDFNGDGKKDVIITTETGSSDCARGVIAAACQPEGLLVPLHSPRPRVARALT